MAQNQAKMTEEEIADYKKQHKEMMVFFKVGASDPFGNKIKRILSTSDSYVIYEIDTDVISESLRVQVFAADPGNSINLEGNFEEIRVPLNEVRSVLYKARRDNAFKNIIASAIVQGLNGKVEQSIDYLNKIKLRIETEHKAQFRNKLTFLFSNLFFVFVLVLISILQLLGTFECLYGNESPIYTIVNIATFGSVGGFISVSLKLKNKIFETGVPNFMYIAYGFERSVVSVIGAIILYFMIVSNLVLGYVMELDRPIHTLLIFSAIAGFSENLIPDLFEKLEKGIKTKE